MSESQDDEVKRLLFAKIPPPLPSPATWAQVEALPLAPRDVFERGGALEFALVLVAHEDFVLEVFGLDDDGTAFARAFDDRLEEFRFDAPLADFFLVEVEKLIGAGLDAEAHFGDVAETHQFAPALLQNREEDVRCAQVFAAPFVGFVAGGLDERAAGFCGFPGRCFLVVLADEAFLEELALGHDGDAPAVGALAFGGGLERLERLGAEHLLERHREHHKARGVLQPVLAAVVGRGEQRDDRVDIGLRKRALALVVEDEPNVAVFEQKLLQVCAVADVEPRVGRDEAEAALRVEQR